MPREWCLGQFSVIGRLHGWLLILPPPDPLLRGRYWPLNPERQSLVFRQPLKLRVEDAQMEPLPAPWCTRSNVDHRRLTMKRLVLTTAAVALLAGLVATSALAKGASAAKITGPGLGEGIRLAGEGTAGGGDQLMELAQASGFFPAVFVTSPNPMSPTRPRGELGPRYEITYSMPGPNGTDELRQEIYPYAQPSPVTHVESGQRFFGTEKTVGGWYVASTTLKDAVVAAGLPETPPVDRGFEFPWRVVGMVAAMVALAAAAGAFLRGRRRSRPVVA